jgi:membrane protease YdiL (CAAX protease family)
LQSTRPALPSALVLGLLIARWHLPLVMFGLLGPIGLLATVAITVVYVWLFNRTGGSVLLTLVAHASRIPSIPVRSATPRPTSLEPSTCIASSSS